MEPVKNGIRSRPRTRFTERRLFRSSIHLQLGGSRSRSIDEGSGSVEFHVDPNTKKLVNSALSAQEKEKSPEFVSKPKRQFVNEGETAKFKAQIEGSSVLSWSLNGKTLANGGKCKIYTEKDVHILELSKVSPDDQGSYICKIENTAGAATASAELEVFVRPKSQTGKKSMFLSPTVDIPLEDTEFADKEKNATLICKFHNGIDGTAKWYKDGRELNNWQAKSTFDGRTAKLVLREASKRNCGVYECIVTNSGGEAKTKALVSLLDPSVKPTAPKFTLTLNDQDIEAGDKLVLETQVTGTPRPSLKWYKDNTELGSSQDIRMEFKDGKGRLIMDNLELTEGSKFTCVAKNMAGESQTMATVNTSGSADAREPPIFTKELQDMEVSNGDRVEMSVEVKGTPPIDIVWVHNNREIPPLDPVCRMITKGNTHMLVIPEVFPEDAGEYVCEAYNDYGDTDTFCRLNVHEERDVDQNVSQKAPEFVVSPRNVHVDEGANTTLSCHIGGNPPPSVQWSRGRQILKHGTKYKISSIGDEHFLDISSANVEDIGQYTCTLCNPTGTTSATCQISVGDISAQPTPHCQRSHHKIRSQRDHSSKYLGTESESSDVSSLDSEHFLADIAVKTKAEPVHCTQLNLRTNGEQFNVTQSNFKNKEQFHGTQSALKRNSEPFHGKQTVNETVVERKISAPVNRNPVEINVVNASSNKINSSPTKVLSFKRPEDIELNIASQFVQSVNIKPANGSQFSLPITKSGEKLREPVIEKKGGVSQVDFRGVLKQKHSSGAEDINGHSKKHVNDTRNKKFESNNPQQNLSRTRQIFEKDFSKTVPSSQQSVKTPENINKGGLKVNQALKKFEENSASVQSDYRNVLKPRKEHSEVHLLDKTNKLEKPSGDAASQLDFRSVLKKKNETKSVPDSTEYGKVKPEFRADQLSDSSFEKKSIQKQRAELVVNVRKKSIDKIITTPKQIKEFEIPTPKQKKAFDLPVKPPLDIQTKKEFKSTSKSEVDLPITKTKSVKSEPQLVEFRSVLTRPERRNSKEFLVGDIIKPVARRLSQSKQLTMDIKPEIKEKLESQSVDYGKEVVLQCQVTGSPKPDLSWSINDKEIKQSKFFRMSYRDDLAKLVIAEAFSEDEGEYTCTAQNTSGIAKTSCNLRIEDRPGTPENTTDMIEEPFSPTATPPKIYNICPAEFCILQGGTIEFKASYTSVPPGTVTWSRGKRELKQDARMKIETTDCFSTLTIIDIQPEDTGRFNVKVENRLGADEAYATLSVEDVPDAPVGKPWVSDVGLYAATLSWYGPAYDGGCPITNYRVEMCDAEEQEWTLVTSKCVNTTYRIEKLQAHTPYFFRVSAENKHGLSQPCMTPDVTVTSDRRPSALLRLPSTESDDVFTHENTELFTPMSEYGLVSPLSPDEVSFEHREVTCLSGRVFENFYNCLQEVGKGKFGSVYKCEEKSTGKIWAAKVIKCRESEKKKLYLEVEIMNKLKHPKILQLWDVFDAPRKTILVMEYIGGGELFERVIDDDFELMERDCIQFMRQICDAVHYMHGRNILHLDLKPENILCIKNESNKVKIIDFGLARYYSKNESVRVLFGTPEFIAPEVVNYDEIGFTTDMWSIGVICYVLLTGLSPFMGDSDAETLSNVTQGEFDFEEEEFDSVSNDGKNFIERLLVKKKKHRMTSIQALEHPWLANDAARLKNHRINTKNLKKFMARRKWQKTGNAIRALGRMRSSLQKLMKPGTGVDSLSSASGVGSSSSNSSLSSMGSQNTISDVINPSTPLKVIGDEDIVTTNQNGGKFVESTNHNQGLKNSWKSTNEIKDNNSDVNGHSVDINLNLTNEKNKTAFVRLNGSDNKDRSVEKTLNPVNTCNDCKTTGSSNSVVEDSRTKHLPVFKKEMVDSKAFPGDVVRFDVEYIADKNTNVSWYFEDELLVEDENHCVQQSGNGVCSLIIKNVCEDDDGEYMCKIVNSSGEETCSAELIVYGAL